MSLSFISYWDLSYSASFFRNSSVYFKLRSWSLWRLSLCVFCTEIFSTSLAFSCWMLWFLSANCLFSLSRNSIFYYIKASFISHYERAAWFLLSVSLTNISRSLICFNYSDSLVYVYYNADWSLSYKDFSICSFSFVNVFSWPSFILYFAKTYWY